MARLARVKASIGDAHAVGARGARFGDRGHRLVILGTIGAALRQSLIISEAGLGIFFMRPIAAVLTIAALASSAIELAGPMAFASHS